MNDQTITCYPGEGATAAEMVALADEYRIAAQFLVQNGRPKVPSSRAPFRMVAIHAVELYLTHSFSDRVTARARCGVSSTTSRQGRT